MARLLEVRSKIKDDDLFYLSISEVKEIGNNLPTRSIVNYADGSCTGADIKQYVLSFQSSFLDVVEEDISILSSRFTTYLSDFVDIKLLHTTHYEDQTEELRILAERTQNNRDLNTKNYRTYEYLRKQSSRLTRLYHVLPSVFRSSAIPLGGMQMTCPDGVPQTYINVNGFKVHNIDITNEDRNFWGAMPGDIIEVVGQQLLDRGDESESVQTEVKYRVIYTVNNGWDPFTQGGQAVFDIPVTFRGGTPGDIQLAFQGDTIPSNLFGNIEDFEYAQFSIFPCINLDRYQELRKVYLDYVNESPIGMCFPWFENSEYSSGNFKSKYGTYIKKNMGGRYMIGEGGEYWANKGVDSNYNDETVSKPKNGGNNTNQQSGHDHNNTLNVEESGEHKHFTGSNWNAASGTGSSVKSSAGGNENLSEPRYPTGNQSFANTHVHTVTLSTASNHEHTFSGGWDNHNQMYSLGCIWIEKVEHPAFILTMRQTLADLYGDDFDK